MNWLGERDGRMEGSAVVGGGELTDVEAWLKGVSIVGLPRNLMLVPDTGKPSSKTGAPAQDLHEVLETAGFPNTPKHLEECYSSAFVLVCVFLLKPLISVWIGNVELAVGDFKNIKTKAD